ncbi:PREDICTED: uncharacterized protein LOC109180009 isoform X2 [Ipomoea nil]|uniref:uncharacterized protein LOC109180009 isoform X2 n=1 Tax=Ipomoea nil TaxID=35883 RepID=UPI000901EDA4|nr:PREDICTED: uncharacterized protein LOC109180009 isoform X2 [Ipomoea nil]
MERRFGRNDENNVPDLTDFINDMFFGTIKVEKKEYNLTGDNNNRRQESEEFYDSGSVKACNAPRKGTPRFVNDHSRGEEDYFDSSTRSSRRRASAAGREARYTRAGLIDDEDEDFESSTRSVSSRLTQDWLKEAKRMVANSSSSPGRESPGRLVGSPRFATVQGRLSVSSNTEKRDSFSRSARRGRTVDGFSEEILIKSGKHSRNKSETPLDQSSPDSPSTAIHKWFSGILKPPNSTISIPDSPPAGDHSPSSPNLALPPRQSTLRKSRFQNASHQTTNQLPSKRTFKPPAFTNALPDDPAVVSPPKNFFDSSRRGSISSAPNDKILSPPRKLVESVHRRCISASTCSMDKIYRKNGEDNSVQLKEKSTEEGEELNGFLRDQRQKIGMILNREIDLKARIVLSGHSNSTSSMVAAICYAMLLENRRRANNERDESRDCEVVVPVMNSTRANMWKQHQAAWLFHHVGLDVKALFFFDEVDLETLTESKQVIIQVLGEDVLKTNGEVVSECTVLTDNYCEEAYDLLQTPMLKKLLLAGILLDTRNLMMLSAAKVPMKTRDAEAVQLLTVGSAPDYRNTLFDQLMQDHNDNKSFNEALQKSYGEPPAEGNHNEEALEQQVSVKNSNRRKSKSDKSCSDTKNSRSSKASSNTGKPTPSPKEVTAPTPPKAAVDPPRPKNRFFLAKWFGFGSK